MEIWKTIKEHTDYEISNLGNVKSNKRKEPIILNASTDKDGYFYVNLCNKKYQKKFKVHQLVAMGFLNHKPCGSLLVVNHIDFNKQNNNVNNLELVTTRENSNRKHLKSVSEYVGVGFHGNKWQSRITINGNRKHLGCFTNELDAHYAYQYALSQI